MAMVAIGSCIQRKKKETKPTGEINFKILNLDFYDDDDDDDDEGEEAMSQLRRR
jgi:hypothetical protein